jgi:hypothetical protein
MLVVPKWNFAILAEPSIETICEHKVLSYRDEPHNVSSKTLHLLCQFEEFAKRLAIFVFRALQS